MLYSIMTAFSHFIYPLDLRPGTNWRAEIGTANDKRVFLVRQENMTKKNLHGEIFADWGISKCFKQIKIGDFVWFYAGWQVRRIVAVGRVETEPAPTANKPKYRKWSHSHRLLIRIDNELTIRLQEPSQAIHYEDFQQWVPGAVRRANKRTNNVLQRWLKKKPTKHSDLDDEVYRVRRTVMARTGQPRFREALRTAYGDRCAISGATEPTALVAAHIRGVKDKGRHNVQNGLLLRADLHNLFDAGQITIDVSYRVHVAEIVTDKQFRALDKRRLFLPESRKLWPSKNALETHRRKFSPEK